MVFRVAAIAGFRFALIVLVVWTTYAQSNNFRQTGIIRAVVSETDAPFPSWKGTEIDPGIRFSGSARSKIDYYFTYSDGEPLNEKWLPLPNGKSWSLLSNHPVVLDGFLNDARLIAATARSLEPRTAGQNSVSQPTAGVYRTVAVPLTIQPQSSLRQRLLSVTPEQIRNSLFNDPRSVNAFYLEASYGMLSFSGVHQPQSEVVPVTVQAVISSNCQNQIINEFTPIVRQRLLEQGIDTTNGSVDLGIIIYNDTPGCPPYPFATRGALGVRGIPLWLWMPESWFVTSPAILTHEIGHALGGNHPFAFRCGDYDPRNCTAFEADDRDLMTSSGRYIMMPNNYERRRWGWHPPGAFDRPSTGTVEMFDLHSPVLTNIKDGARRGRFFFRNLVFGDLTGWDVYPEARQNHGRFEQYQGPDAAFRLGVTIRMGHSDYTHPDAASIIIDPNDTLQLDDAPLRANQQVSLGRVTIRCLREHNPAWGTRVSAETIFAARPLQ